MTNNTMVKPGDMTNVQVGEVLVMGENFYKVTRTTTKSFWVTKLKRELVDTWIDDSPYDCGVIPTTQEFSDGEIRRTKGLVVEGDKQHNCFERYRVGDVVYIR